jgi:Leucine-rich repeat (LRR) protein
MEFEQLKNSALDNAGELWIIELYKWAGDNNIPELHSYEDIVEEDNGELVDCGFRSGLPRDIDVLLNLEELNLSGHNCLEIPAQIRHLTKLKKFSFAKQPTGLQPTFSEIADGPNKITQIPDWISELVNLELLNLSGNEIDIVPKSIGQLQNLKQLYLHDNKILFIAHALGQLDNLEVLWIQDNLLYEYDYMIDELYEDYNLADPTEREDPDQDLDVILLHDNMLNALTDNIIQLKNLINLWFDRRRPPIILIKARPEDWQKVFSKFNTPSPLRADEYWMEDFLVWVKNNGIGFYPTPNTPKDLSNISGIGFCDLKLNSFPDSFSKFNNVKDLSISNSQIDTIPNQIKGLGKLTSLSFYRCQLTCLPEWIGDLQELSTLLLDYNKITNLPDSISKLVKLEDLCLRSNQLTSIPSVLNELEKLIILDLSNNEINSLPGSIKGLSKLKNLYLSGNKLTSIPDAIKGLINLEILDLDDNKLTSFPDVITGLTNLERLCLNGNKLTSIPDAIKGLTNLESLSLYNNKLTILPTGLGDVEKLKSLDLSGNQFNCLPDPLRNLANLTELHLSHNRLVSLPEWIGELKELASLHVNGNKITRLPDHIKGLPKLISLRLDYYNLTTLTDELGELDRLERLALNINDRDEFICSFSKFTSSNRFKVEDLTLILNPVGYLQPWWSGEHKRQINELLPNTTIYFS